MDIHHAMIVRVAPAKVFQALTDPRPLEIWMDAPVISKPGSTMEFQYDQGRRALNMEVLHMEENRQVKWRVLQPMWPSQAIHEITWTLTPIENSTAIDFRMTGWAQSDDTFASVSYKWALFMLRLKIYLGDLREIKSILPT